MHNKANYCPLIERFQYTGVLAVNGSISNSIKFSIDKGVHLCIPR